MNTIRLFKFPIQIRTFATKPQKKPVERKKTAEEKARDAKKIAQKKLASENWNKKETSGEKSKYTPFFIKYMLNAEQRKLQTHQISREPTLWERQVAQRYQYEMSRQNNRENFAIECAMRIRDAAIAALPSHLQEEALNAGKSKRSIPLYRRCAAWTPPDPKLQNEGYE